MTKKSAPSALAAAVSATAKLSAADTQRLVESLASRLRDDSHAKALAEGRGILVKVISGAVEANRGGETQQIAEDKRQSFEPARVTAPQDAESDVPVPSSVLQLTLTAKKRSRIVVDTNGLLRNRALWGSPRLIVGRDGSHTLPEPGPMDLTLAAGESVTFVAVGQLQPTNVAAIFGSLLAPATKK